MTYYCSKCKTDIEEKVYLYSKEHLGEILCRKCQNSSNKTKSKKLSKKSTYSYDYNMIKGRIAEALIEQLFLKLNYNIFRYGMENTIPGIMNLLKGVRSDVADTIRKMPDFVIQNTTTGEVFFVEVKFRANEEFSVKDVDKDYPFENAYFILVSKKHIKCLSYQDLKKGKKINPKSQNYLGSVKAFETDKEIIKDFCDYAVKFFEGV
jgi:hypothetical protein